jgi:hypothetical protein
MKHYNVNHRKTGFFGGFLLLTHGLKAQKSKITGGEIGGQEF